MTNGYRALLLALVCWGCGAAPKTGYWSPADPLVLTPAAGFETPVDAAAETFRQAGFMVLVGPGGVPVSLEPLVTVTKTDPATGEKSEQPRCGITVITRDPDSGRAISVDKIAVGEERPGCGSVAHNLLHEICHALAPIRGLHAPAPSVFQHTFDPNAPKSEVLDAAAIETVRDARRTMR